MSLIFFIGMPGCGKTYWAERLAETCRLEYIDTDEMITLFEQRSVNEIFDAEGEGYFRQKEKELLDSIIEENDESVLIACGGGLPVYYDNLLRMKENGCVVYLKSGVDKLCERIAIDRNRPLLNDQDDMRTTLTELLNKREPYYLQADQIVNVDTASIEDFKKIIRLCTEQH